MKKFLTVLLALSVVFTYSFSSVGAVFAADAEEYTIAEVLDAIGAQEQSTINRLKTTVKAAYLDNYDLDSTIQSSYTPGEGDAIKFSKAAIEKEIDKILEGIAGEISAVAEAQMKEANAAAAGSDEYFDPAEWVNGETLYLEDKVTEATVDHVFEAAVINEEADFEQLKTSLYIIADGRATAVNPDTDTYQAGTDYRTLKAGVQLFERIEAVAPVEKFTKAQKDEYVDAVTDEYNKYSTSAGIYGYIDADIKSAEPKYLVPLLTAEHAVQRAEVVALFNKVNLDNYNSVVPADADENSEYYFGEGQLDDNYLTEVGYYSYQARVKAALDAAKKELEKNDIQKNDDAAKIAGYINTILEEEDFFAEFKAVIDKVPTLQQEGWDKEDLATMISRITAAMKSYVTEQKAAEQTALTKVIRDLENKDTLTAADKEKLAQAKKDLAALDSEYTAVEKAFENTIKGYNKTTAEGYFYTQDEADIANTGLDPDVPEEAAKMVKAGDLKDDKIKENFKVKVEGKALAVAQLAKVSELEADAAAMNQMLGVNGKPMYDKDAVAKALEEAIKAVYEADTVAEVNAITLSDYVDPIQDPVKDEMKYVLDGDALTGKVELEKKFYDAVNSWTTTGYDEEKAKEVEAIIESTKAAIRSAKTIEAVDEAFLAGYTRYDAVPTTADRDETQNDDKAYNAKAKEYELELGLLIDAKVARYEADGSDFAKDFGITADDLGKALVGTAADDDGLYAAYTVEEMKTIYDEAVATVNNLKSAKDLDAELAALNEEITAIKAPATAADKAAVLALAKKVKAFVEYADMVNYDVIRLKTTQLETLVNDIKAIDAKEIQDAVAEIMKDGKITLDEKEAVNAVIDLIDAYAENYGKDAKAALVAGNVETVYDSEDTIRNLERLAVESMIAKIDPTAAPLDIAAIEAARAAYDALGETTIHPDLFTKLLALEGQVKTYTINAVRAFQISTTTQLVKGKKMVVKWNVIKGDESAIDGYRVYYSTKKSNKGFKVLADVKGKKLNHTSIKKTVKKGTRVYYRVKAYKMIDGLRYLSAYSSAGHRTWK